MGIPEINNNKINALLELALKYHNAKRYSEAAWLYQKIIDTYPKNGQTFQYAYTNLNDLKRKIENLQIFRPKELKDGDPLLDDNEPVEIYPVAISTFFTPNIESAQEPIKLPESPIPALKLNYPSDADICANCGHVSKPKTITRGSFVIEIILWLTFLIPGLIYSIWRLTTRYKACPQCFAPYMVPLNSPRGRKLVEEYEITLYS